MPRRALLVLDANVLIDYAHADRSVLELTVRHSVRARVAALDRFRDRQPSSILLRGMLVWTIAVFLVTVVHPILRSQSSWIPSIPRPIVIYGSTSLYAAPLVLSFMWTSRLLGPD